MARAELIPGNRFRIYRYAGTPEAYDYVAIATTISLTRNTAASEVAVIGSDYLQVAAGTRSWDLSFSGRADVEAFRRIEFDQASNLPRRYRILVDTVVQRSYTGLLIFTQLAMTSSERGFVAFQANCRGHDALDIL